MSRLSRLVSLTALGLVAAVLVLGTYWILLGRQRSEALAKEQERLSNLREEARTLEIVAGKLEEFRRKVQELEAQLETLKRILPAEEHLAEKSPLSSDPALFDQLRQLAVRNAVVVKSLSSRSSASRRSHDEIPVDLEVEGSYAAVASYVGSMARLPRLLNLTRIEVQRLPPARSRASVLFSAYRYRDEARR